ncbi:hypothetical protein NLX86_30925 [Streptomyces sp. A3M-1-3]|uniref:hypothetical protein n=1 Tax=Streptomyces sp. A3M-1-3 TaxID=2962044 RepID=UPI0020B8E916|nr:hypothetical protein [Streptomyces sp. A3M-1-3]MCP3822340.1 hypothetical protein [Streptomyces sp. A3M-1-3]
MGSLRNPIGPLPSSIYWRRRAVAMSLVALLGLLIVWVVSSGGGNGDKDGDQSDGKGPAPSITPGPTGSGPAISEAPGGRDESGGTGGGGGDGGTDAGAGGKNGDTPVGGSANGGGGTPVRVPVGSSLPDCTAGAVQLTLRSVKNAYEPGEKPKFELIVKNVSGATCKVDFGPKAAVLTITEAGGDDEVWSSADCPSGPESVLFRVPAKSGITHRVEWDLKQSAPQCATPPAGAAKPGTYLVEAKVPGLSVTPASFVLEKD